MSNVIPNQNPKNEQDKLFVVRDKSRNIIATTPSRDRAKEIRQVMYLRERRFTDVMPFRPRNKMEEEIGSKLMVK